MIRTIKKLPLTSRLNIGLFLVIVVLFKHTFLDLPILGDLKLSYISKNNYHLIFRGEKIAKRVTGLDSWYVEKTQVFGSTSDIDAKNPNTLVYFYIDVCSGERFTTHGYLEFDLFLGDKQISKDKRNWMSGDNALDIKKAEYSSAVVCE